MDTSLGPIQHATRLLSAASTPADLLPHLTTFLSLYQNRLWHQLGATLLAILSLAASDPSHVDIPAVLKEMAMPIEDRLDPSVVVEMHIRAASAIAGASLGGASVAAEVLDALAERFFPRPNCLAPHIRAKAAATTHLLTTYTVGDAALAGSLRGRVKDLEGKLASLGAGAGMLGGVPASVHAEFYRAAARVSKAVDRDMAAFYSSGMLYLACVDNIESVTTCDERLAWARELCVAAVVGEGVYTFGELLTHPLIALVETQQRKEGTVEWRIRLARAFQRGDHATYTSLTPYFSQEVEFRGQEDAMLDKVRLMSLVEAVFERTLLVDALPSSASNITNSSSTDMDIDATTGASAAQGRKLAAGRRIELSMLAARAQVPPERIELSVMRALSRGLIKGRIDQVAGELVIDGVTPRVLDTEQVGVLRARIGGWEARVRNVESQLRQGLAHA